MAIVTFRYWAAAKEAAGVGEETIRAETLGEALAAASGNAGSGNAGSGNAGSGNAGSGNAGSGNAGSGNAGAATAAEMPASTHASGMSSHARPSLSTDSPWESARRKRLRSPTRPSSRYCRRLPGADSLVLPLASTGQADSLGPRWPPRY